MRLLIITSENLNPHDTLPSTFELSQARILSAEHDVQILSVQVHVDLINRVKGLVKKILGKSTEKNSVTDILYDCWRSLYYLVKGNTKVKVHNIEGITIYEGNTQPLTYKKVFDDALLYWVKTGMYAFEQYYENNGLPDLIHAHGRFLNAGVLALEIKKKHGCPYIYTEHSTWYQSKKASGAAIPYLKNVIHNAAVFTCVSTSLVKHVSNFVEEELPQARVSANVMDTVFQKPLPANKENAKFTFINIASLEEKKRIDILLKAFALSFKSDNNCLLTICGDGPLLQELRALTETLGIKEQVVFAGKKNKGEIVDFLDSSNVFVLSSQVETFGVVVIEALSRGLPVVATICGGPEFIINTTNGLLVTVNDVEGLSEAMARVKTMYFNYDRERIQSDVLAKYGSETFLKNMNKIYQEALS